MDRENWKCKCKFCTFTHQLAWNKKERRKRSPRYYLVLWVTLSFLAFNSRFEEYHQEKDLSMKNKMCLPCRVVVSFITWGTRFPFSVFPLSSSSVGVSPHVHTHLKSWCWWLMVKTSTPWYWSPLLIHFLTLSLLLLLFLHMSRGSKNLDSLIHLIQCMCV